MTTSKTGSRVPRAPLRAAHLNQSRTPRKQSIAIEWNVHSVSLTTLETGNWWDYKKIKDSNGESVRIEGERTETSMRELRQRPPAPLLASGSEEGTIASCCFAIRSSNLSIAGSRSNTDGPGRDDSLNVRPAGSNSLRGLKLSHFFPPLWSTFLR